MEWLGQARGDLTGVDLALGVYSFALELLNGRQAMSAYAIASRKVPGALEACEAERSGCWDPNGDQAASPTCASPPGGVASHTRRVSERVHARHG